MGTLVATIIMAMISVIAWYNVLHIGTAPGIMNATAQGAGQIISALQGK